LKTYENKELIILKKYTKVLNNLKNHYDKFLIKNNNDIKDKIIVKGRKQKDIIDEKLEAELGL